MRCLLNIHPGAKISYIMKKINRVNSIVQCIIQVFKLFLKTFAPIMSSVDTDYEKYMKGFKISYSGDSGRKK